MKISYGSDTRTFGCNRKSLSPKTRDFENLIKVYDRPKALFYCDPPYHKTEYFCDFVFTETDHERLKAVLSQIKGRFILSYNDDEYIHELYKNF